MGEEQLFSILFECLLNILFYFVAKKFARGRYAQFEYITKVLLLMLINIATYFYALFFISKLTGLLVFLAIRCICSYLILFCAIKRLHDSGFPELIAFFMVVPMIGGILLPLAVMFGDSGDWIGKYDESINYQNLFPSNFQKIKLAADGHLMLLILKNSPLFIKKENYKYTIMFKLDDYQKVYEVIRSISKKAVFSQTSKYCYYKKVKKQELLNWVNKYYG